MCVKEIDVEYSRTKPGEDNLILNNRSPTNLYGNPLMSFEFFTNLTKLVIQASNELSGQVFIEGFLTQLLFVNQLTFGFRGTERI